MGQQRKRQEPDTFTQLCGNETEAFQVWIPSCFNKYVRPPHGTIPLTSSLVSKKQHLTGFLLLVTSQLSIAFTLSHLFLTYAVRHPWSPSIYKWGSEHLCLTPLSTHSTTASPSTVTQSSMVKGGPSSKDSGLGAWAPPEGQGVVWHGWEWEHHWIGCRLLIQMNLFTSHLFPHYWDINTSETGKSWGKMRSTLWLWAQMVEPDKGNVSDTAIKELQSRAPARQPLDFPQVLAVLWRRGRPRWQISSTNVSR